MSNGLNPYNSGASQDLGSNSGTNLFKIQEENKNGEYMLSSNSINTTISLICLDPPPLKTETTYDEAISLLNEAQACVRDCRYEDALKILEENKILFESFNNSENDQGLIIFYTVGFIYYRMYLYPFALKYHKLAEEYGLSHGMTHGNAGYFRAIYNMLADLYMQNEDFEESWRYSDLALDIVRDYFADSLSKKLPTNIIRGELLYTYGATTEEAKKYFQEAETRLKGVLVERFKNGDNTMTGFTFFQLTQLYIKWTKVDYSKLEEAKKCLADGFEYSRKDRIGDEYFIIGRHWRNKGMIYMLEIEANDKREEEVMIRREANNCYKTAIRILDGTLPSTNFFSVQFRKEYQRYFGEEYNLQVLDSDVFNIDEISSS